MIRQLLFPVGVALLLGGCLQVELAGPVAGADITITRLGSNTTVASGLTTSDSDSKKLEIGEEAWSNLKTNGKALLLGTVELPDMQLSKNAYYLVTATGGVDQDADANGTIDPSGTALQVPVRAIMSGEQLSRPFGRVTMLSEAIYRVLEPELQDLSNAQLKARLNELATNMVADINNDGQSDYDDVLLWSHFFQKDKYKGSPEFLARMPRTFHDSRYEDDIATYDSMNLVENASFTAYETSGVKQRDLVACAFAVTFSDLCNLGTLPLIGMDTSSPTIADIMARLVTSDDWIAQRFEQVLSIMPEDIISLFRGVTVISIGREIRPSFYNSAIGSLNLDADFFWLLPSEQETVSTDPDFRAEFANQVNFAHLWRYVEDGRDAYEAYYVFSDLGWRELSDIELPVANLLLHELAHANDFVPLEVMQSLPRNASLAELIIPTVSDQLQQLRPLSSDVLAGLASVLYFGVSATPTEANYTATQVGQIFAPDPVAHLYGYSNQYEDLAMLFDEAMMYLLYGVRRDVAFTTVPGSNAADRSCNAYRIGWGMRGRITAENVLPGAKFVVEKLLPGRAYATQLDRLPKPDLLTTGMDWCNGINLSSNPRSQSAIAPQTFQAQLRHIRIQN